MNRNARWNVIFPSLAAVLTTLVVASPPARAQVVKPFKITGEGVGPEGLPLPGQPPRPHWIIGNATHLGRHYGEGTVQTDSANVEPDGRITGEFGSGSPFVFTAANGDTLTCVYGRELFGASQEGTFELIPLPDLGPGIYMAYWIAEFVPQPELCTGKFAGISGKWVMYAVSEPFLLGSSAPVGYSWEGEGKLTFRQGK